MSSRLAFGRLASGVGRSGGVVMSELFYDDQARWAALSSAEDGQRMAALPAALAARALAAGTEKTGAMPGYELLGARTLVEGVAAEGFTVTTG